MVARESAVAEKYDPIRSMIKRQLILDLPSNRLIRADRGLIHPLLDRNPVRLYGKSFRSV